ncbi:MAG: UDP-N-acetylmuramate dehydrogenase [Candidatus Azotimanducaceae bacterium]|jgi:UDP-N-acetylmuramate dehydrogenase
MSIDIQQNVNLKALNTLGLDVAAEYFVRVESDEDLRAAVAFASQKRIDLLVLGGGSNLVLHQPIRGLCIHMAIKGYQMDGSRISVGAGNNWHEFVQTTLRDKRFGLENLSLIPGQVGAAPIQNIGAYGVELAEKLVRVDAIDIESGADFSLSHSECQFAYRHSVFKSRLLDKAVITSIVLDLDLNFQPRLDYAGLAQYLDEHHLSVSADTVSQAVCAIRLAKLPNPAVVGNVGSFFKNPVVDEAQIAGLKAIDPVMPMHRQDNGSYKLSAAFLIDQAGLKGLRVGHAVVSMQHALVIQNEGGATGNEVLALAAEIQQIVKSRFDISLDIEPRLFPTKP